MKKWIPIYLSSVAITTGLIVILSLASFWIPQTGTPRAEASVLPTFASCSALSEELSKVQSRSVRRGGVMELDLPAPNATTALDSSGSAQPSYSSTNIQVEGIDEPDLVKSDGKYLYSISDQGLTITKAYPAEQARVLSRTLFSQFMPQQLLLFKDRLLVIGTRVEQQVKNVPLPEGGEGSAMKRDQSVSTDPSSLTSFELWDVSNRENPKRIRVTEFEGNLVSARQISDHVYVVMNKFVYQNAERMIPMFGDRVNPDSDQTTTFAPAVNCDQVAYFDPIASSNLMTIASLSMSDPQEDVEKLVIAGSGQNIYASGKYLYVAERLYDNNWGVILENVVPAKDSQTVVHRFALKDGGVRYAGNTPVPGTVLNQFSMDESKGMFRIATTVGQVSRDAVTSKNNVYVLDPGFAITGRLEDLAPGEKIYSARFIGDRGYLVTFQKVDPLFVIDLSEPTNPTVLGKLKIPGYSDYLHPYDATHLIGIGKDAVASEQGNFAWYQGLKLALFDVSDPENPKQLHQEIIGDRGTDSPVLTDHKAFLFDRQKNLLVLPVTLAQISDDAKKDVDAVMGTPLYGDYVYQGAYVYRLTLDDGFELRGRITHVSDEDQFEKLGSFFPNVNEAVMRSMYIEDALYTLSNQKLKIHSLSDLTEVKTLDLVDSAI